MVALIVIGLQVSATFVALVAGTWIAAHTLRQRYGIARAYDRSAGHLAAPDTAMALVPVVAIAAASLTARWWREETLHTVVNPAKWAYLGSTAALLVVLAVHPIAGFVGYVGSHAAEYFLVVRQRLRTAPVASGALHGLVGAVGPGGTLALYAVSVVGLMTAFGRYAGPGLANVAVLSLGGLHLLHDGFIWRSPRRAPTPTTTQELQPCA